MLWCRRFWPCSLAANTGGSPTARAIPPALLSEPSIWLAALVLLLLCPAGGVHQPVDFSLLRERGQDEREAGGLLSGFWAAFLASRL